MPANEQFIDRFVRRLCTRAPLSESDRESLLALPYTLRTLEPMSYLVREGDPPQHCGLLVSGFAFRQKLTADGARQIIALQVPGDLVDLQNLFLDVSDHNVQALSRVEVASFSRADLRRLTLTSPSIAHAFFIEALIDASIFREWILNVGRRDSRARIAHLLCEFAMRLEYAGLIEEYGYELPMTQEQLADAVGLTAVHVNRTLKLLDAEGHIVRDKRNVRIPDWHQMRKVADFNERYLHMDQVPYGPAG